MDRNKRKNATEAENSIELSTKNKKKVQPAAELISGSDAASAKVTTRCYPLRYETFSPARSCVASKVHKITSSVDFLIPQ